jgi:hypothetical protein
MPDWWAALIDLNNIPIRAEQSSVPYQKTFIVTHIKGVERQNHVELAFIYF